MAQFIKIYEDKEYGIEINCDGIKNTIKTIKLWNGI